MSAKVFDELTCPECGGRIGGDGSGGMPACTCFEEKTPVSTRKPPPPKNLEQDSKPAERTGIKLCRVCGKDLSGKPRLKDEGGYLCKPCADEEDQKDASLLKCPECQRRLKPAAFVEYRGALICKRCHQHHADNDKLKVAKVELHHHNEHEKQSLLRLMILLAIALIFVGLSLWKTLL